MLSKTSLEIRSLISLVRRSVPNQRNDHPVESNGFPDTYSETSTSQVTPKLSYFYEFDVESA